MLLYSKVQCNTVQYSTLQYSTVQYSTVQYSTVQYSTVHYHTVQRARDHLGGGRGAQADREVKLDDLEEQGTRETEDEEEE